MSNKQTELLPGTIEPVRRESPDDLFYLIVESVPEPHSEDFGTVGGAFVSFWIDADDLPTAQQRAVAFLADRGWHPLGLESWQFVSRDTYPDANPPKEDEPDMRKFVEKAFADGQACLFCLWPVGAEDSE